MQFYIPIVIALVIIIVQYHNAKKGNLLLTVILAISFSIFIKLLLMEYSFLFLLIYINFFLYLMSLITYFTRSSIWMKKLVLIYASIFVKGLPQKYPTRYRVLFKIYVELQWNVPKASFGNISLRLYLYVTAIQNKWIEQSSLKLFAASQSVIFYKKQRQTPI